MKSLSYILLATVALVPALQAEDKAFTLDDKRYIEELKSTKIPEIQKKLDEVAGSEIPVKVEWDSFQTRESVDMLVHTLDALPVAIAEIAKDDMGKEALASKVKSFTLTNVESDDWKKNSSIEDGAFTIAWKFDGGSYVNDSMIANRLNELL